MKKDKVINYDIKSLDLYLILLQMEEQETKPQDKKKRKK